MCEPSASAKEYAHRLLIVQTYLLNAVSDGGAVSELHLHSLIDDTLLLLVEIGGFDDVLGQYA